MVSSARFLLPLMRFSPRRSHHVNIFTKKNSILSKHASVCSDHAAATEIGIEILKRGGNAADAAVATMAAITILQPWDCSIGGDTQCIFYRKKDNKVMTVNGSGRTGKNATLDKIRSAGITNSVSDHGLWVSVPGAVAGMVKTVEQLGSGKVTLKDIFSPSIRLAEEGFPVSIKYAHMWKTFYKNFLHSKNANDLLIDGRVPEPGDIMYSPKTAKVLRNVADFGLESFYSGATAQSIATAVQEYGGVLTVEDMKEHILNPPNPLPSEALSVDFHGVTIWEMRPNTMGIVALVAFNVLKAYDLKGFGYNSPDYIHLLIEVTKQAYVEAWEYLCDPKCCPKRLEDLLTEECAQKLRDRIDFKRAYQHHQPFIGSDTSCVAAVDEEGNGCSFFCSLSRFFGTGIIPDDCGFTLHDRASSMTLKEGRTNCYGPNKLPLHTNMPAIVTETATNELLAVIGNTGRWMQPLGQMQVLLNMKFFGMDPQVAVNQPKFLLGHNRHTDKLGNLQEILFESEFDPSSVPSLESKGHTCRSYSGPSIAIFSKAHAIVRSKLFDPSSAARSPNTWWSGVDTKFDGCAMGY